MSDDNAAEKAVKLLAFFLKIGWTPTKVIAKLSGKAAKGTITAAEEILLKKLKGED